jgi:hypothetical protein
MDTDGEGRTRGVVWGIRGRGGCLNAWRGTAFRESPEGWALPVRLLRRSRPYPLQTIRLINNI